MSTPARVCEECARPLVIRASERPANFARRRFCSTGCMHVARRLPLPERNCEFCGKALVRRPNERPSKYLERRYCDHACLGLNARHKLTASKRSPANAQSQGSRSQRVSELPARHCQQCGDVLIRRETEKPHSFESRNFCNRACWCKSRRKRVDERHCPSCGDLLKPRPGERIANFLGRETCSQLCAGKLKRLRRQAEAKPCAQCGQEMTPHYGEDGQDFARRRFCSVKCKNDAARIGEVRYQCIYCGKAKVAPYPSAVRRYCSSACAVRHRNTTQNALKPTTSIEQQTYDALDALGVRFFPQHPIAWMTADAYLPACRVVVEVNGDYWHCNPVVYPKGAKDERQVRAKSRDRQKAGWLKANGYTLIILWESEIHEHGAEALLRERLAPYVQ